MKRTTLMTVGLISTLLTACGGGGSSTTTTSALIAPTAPLAITGNNANQVAGVAVNTGSTASGAGSKGSNSVTAVEVNNGARHRSMRLLLQDILPVLRDHTIMPAAVTGVMITDKTPCDNATGYMNMTFNDADNSGDFSPSDTLTTDFNQCHDALGGTTTNGRMTLGNITTSGDFNTPPWSLEAEMTMSNLVTTDPTGTEKVNGSFTITLATTDGTLETGSMSGTELSFIENDQIATLSNFSITFTSNLGTQEETISIDGTIADSTLGGSVQIATTVPFKWQGTNNPFQGKMTLTGDNSSATITVIDSTNVEITVDENGDGLTDTTLNTTWAEMGVLGL